MADASKKFKGPGGRGGSGRKLHKVEKHLERGAKRVRYAFSNEQIRKTEQIAKHKASSKKKLPSPKQRQKPMQ